MRSIILENDASKILELLFFSHEFLKDKMIGGDKKRWTEKNTMEFPEPETAKIGR